MNKALKRAEELLEFTKVLELDISSAIQKLNTSEDFHFYSRSYVRALASWIEGTLYCHKELFLLDEDFLHSLTVPEFCYFEEKQVQIKNNGNLSSKTLNIPTEQNLKIFFKLIPRKMNSEVVNMSDDCGWTKVIDFYSYRKRMLHPKKTADLQPTIEQIKGFETGREWLKTQFSKIRKSLK